MTAWAVGVNETWYERLVLMLSAGRGTGLGEAVHEMSSVHLARAASDH